jgi:hypothetical protein
MLQLLKRYWVSKFNSSQKSHSVLMALANATELFQAHSDQLEKASFTAAKIHDSLGNVAKITDFVSTYTDMLNPGGSWGDLAVRVLSPPSAIVIGGYGLPPSLYRNIVLFIAGELFNASQCIIN